MSRQTKILIAASACLLLLYSGIAWAVLRCCHDDTHLSQEAALKVIDPDTPGVHANIDCVAPVYHSEAIAVSSLRSQLERLMLNSAAHLSDCWASPPGYGEWPREAHFRSVFNGTHPSSFVYKTPRYLSLSTLRI
jgi:hypothetical protein